MIYVSQGHEHGIGLEVFLKSYLLLSEEDRANFFLAVDEATYNKTIELLKIKSEIFRDLKIHFTKKNDFPQSTKSLSYCLSKITAKDILITLPTSKDQLIFNGKQLAGYTEFFRSYFNDQNIGMVFKAFNENVLLISDHIPLNQVSTYITSELIFNKTINTVENFKRYFAKIDEIVLAGINPHSGENGILGSEEKSLEECLIKLHETLKIKIHGFYSGDTLHFYKNENLNQLFVYMYHDQGLSKFKAQNGLIGINITLGLPFLRLSVDHGTAFELHGKNKANITGMMYLIKTALEVNSNVDQ